MSQDRATPVDPARPESDGSPDRKLAGAVDEAMLGSVISMPDVQPDRVLGADPHDFASLYIRHRQSFGFLARRFLHDPRDVDEVVQETFLRLFLALPELQTELQALAWCRRTVTNLCIDRYRADQRRPRLIDLESLQDENIADEDEELTDPVIRAEDAAIVREALSLLSPLHRAALIKREIEEKSLPQIAAELGVPEQNVKHLLYRARRALRRLLLGTSVEPGVAVDGSDDRAVLARRLARSAHRIGALVLVIACLPFAASQLRSLSTDPVGRPSPIIAPRAQAPLSDHSAAYDAPEAPARALGPVGRAQGPVRTAPGEPAAPAVPLGPPSSVGPPAIAQSRGVERAVSRVTGALRRPIGRASAVLAPLPPRVGTLPNPPARLGAATAPTLAATTPTLAAEVAAPDTAPDGMLSRFQLRGEVPATGVAQITGQSLTTPAQDTLASSSVLAVPTILGEFTLDQTLIQPADSSATVLELAASFSSAGSTSVLSVASGPTSVLTAPGGAVHVSVNSTVAGKVAGAPSLVSGMSVQLVLASDLVTVLSETVTLTTNGPLPIEGAADTVVLSAPAADADPVASTEPIAAQPATDPTVVTVP